MGTINLCINICRNCEKLRKGERKLHPHLSQLSFGGYGCVYMHKQQVKKHVCAWQWESMSIINLLYNTMLEVIFIHLINKNMASVVLIL